MIDRQALLNDLQAVLKRLEADLLDRSESSEVPKVGQTLRSEYERAKDAERTGQNFEDWRSDAITQNAAAWVLSCVFVRFLEDNLLIDPPKIAGPDERLQRARDEHEIYFRKSPTETDREYLLAVFDDLAKLPGTEDIFGEHNPIRELPAWLSGDAAGELLRFFQKIDADTGVLVHDFTSPHRRTDLQVRPATPGRDEKPKHPDPSYTSHGDGPGDPSYDYYDDTRFLGDLYQDLSESARKKYALLQTPEFVEEFILDRALDPAIEEYGLEGLKMIDPACGSGHFLLGAFRRIEGRWERHAPNAKCREVVQWTLDSIFGVDVNPFAVAIARFRLLLAALRTCGVLRLTNSPAFHVNLACGDSLYHGRQRQQTLGDDWTDETHYFAAEDAPALRRMLRDGTYHCVVANPPYITPKDRAANQAYRKLYPKTCHMKYSLAVPFMERIYRLAVPGGFTGQITANSFMKREFGKKLIEEFLPQVDLTHVIDTSLAYIPAHGTPTVILLGRNRAPISRTLRAVMGIKRENSQPLDPARGLVWSAIISQIDDPDSHGEFVSVADTPRDAFGRHPWSIGGGGAAELKRELDDTSTGTLVSIADAVGVLGMTNANDAMIAPSMAMSRRCVERSVRRPIVFGDDIRDWTLNPGAAAFFPYEDEQLIDISDIPGAYRWFWPVRTVLGNRATFSKVTYFIEGRPWWEWHQVGHDRLRTRPSILFALVATHNQFCLDREANLISQAALLVKLPADAGDEDYVGLLGVLNCSLGAFWMRQVFHDKGGGGIGGGIAAESWERFREYDSSKLKQFPLPAGRTRESATQLDRLARLLSEEAPAGLSLKTSAKISHDVIAQRRMRWQRIRQQMIALQEELDWECYRLYGLTKEVGMRSCEDAKQNESQTSSSSCGPSSDMPALQLGQRAFEIVLARKMARGEVQTTWFERHGSTPITELPADWPDDYRRLVERRIEVIENDKNIGLIEQPEYKRRWNTEPWDSQLERALREWMLDRLESYFDFDGRMNDDGKPTAQLDVALTSVARLTDVAGRDAQFMEVAELYRDDPAFDVERLVAELVTAENVPLLPVLRYKPSGLRKRVEWEKTWELQRQEDAIDARKDLPEDDPQYLTEIQASDLKQQEIDDIPVPPKYKSSDFISAGGARYWHLRGKLDVPKERWTSFPHCEGEDGTLVIAWAGYDHLQLARAISAYYVDIQERLGGRGDPRLEPLLACLIELLPWLKQWHNEVDPEFNVPMGDYFEGFIQDEAHQMNKTVEEVRNWQPPKKKGRRKRK